LSRFYFIFVTSQTPLLKMSTFRYSDKKIGKGTNLWFLVHCIFRQPHSSHVYIHGWQVPW
jgi:hypothetical protein